MKQDRLWFRAKLYGWGWTPVTWEGWTLTVLYALGIVGYMRLADFDSHSVSDTFIHFSIPFLILTFLFLFICYAKGERPRWRWGK